MVYRFMLADLRDLLLHPSAFFSRIRSQNPDLLLPIAIVFASGIIEYVSHLLYALITGSGFLTVSPFLPPSVWYIVRSCEFWIGVFIVLFITVRLFSGNVSAVRTLQVSGLGMLPFAILPTASLIIDLVYAPLRQPAALSASGTVRFVFPAHYFIVEPVVWFLFYLWSSYLWAQGVRHTNEMPIGKAVLAVSAVFLAFFGMMYVIAYTMWF